MFTVTTRLTLFFVVTFGTVMSVISLLMYNSFATAERNEFDNELRSYAELLISEVDNTTTTVSGLFDKLDRVTARANLRLHSMRFLLTTRDSVVYEDQISEELADSLQSIHSSRDTTLFHTVTLGDASFRVYNRDITWFPVGVQLGMVVVSSESRLNEALDRLRRLLLLVAPIAVIAASAGGWFVVRRTLAPVSRIGAAAAAISSRNLHERVAVGTTNDELSELAKIFNAMIGRLEATFDAQRRFVADISHDLRTPLQVIQAKLDRLQRDAALSPDVIEDLRQSSSEVDRLAHLASNLLLLARADAQYLTLARVPSRLDELLLESVGKMKTLAAERQISLWVDINEPFETMVDPAAIERAVMNVLDNAIVHSNEGETVTVRLDVLDGSARLTIADEGEGIPAEDLPHIFDRFYRSDRARATRGTGLGLAISRTILEAHGGTIDVASTEGVGTTVTIVLPA